jgi:hypothetical protein
MTIFRFSILATSFLFSGCMTPSRATDKATPIHRFVSVTGLRQLCDGGHAAQCAGYVMATVDALNSIRVAESKPEVICPANGIGDQELVGSVTRYLAANRPPAEYGATTVILAALRKDFPCR